MNHSPSIKWQPAFRLVATSCILSLRKGLPMRIPLMAPRSHVGRSLAVRLAPTGGFIAAIVLAIPGICISATNGVLTTSAELRSLTTDQAAQQIPILVTGIVTAADSSWKGQFFVQDSSGGAWVCWTNRPPVPGDLVKVSGVSNPGGFSRNVALPNWEKLGTAPLPAPKPVFAAQLATAVDDGWRVEASGVVYSEKVDKGKLALNLVLGDARFQASLPSSASTNPISLIGATVRVRGTVATSYNVRRKLLRGVTLFSPQASDLDVVQFSTCNVLTNAAEILSLTASQLSQISPVLITGVVSAAEPSWSGGFFVQDSTGGVYVNNTVQPQPLVGDFVQVQGSSDPGSYAPDVMMANWTKLGTAPLPEAEHVPIDQIVSGLEDGTRVEVSGVVRAAHHLSPPGETKLALKIQSGGNRFWAFPPASITSDPNALVGAMVRMRGTMAASFNASQRQLFNVVMFVPRESDVIIERPSDQTVLQEPLTPLNAIAQYRKISSPDQRIHVKGAVTYQRPGQDIFLHDQTGGLQVECVDTNIFAPGEIVEAIGFPSLERFLPILQDATLIRTRQSVAPVVPVKVSVPKLLDGYNHADLISLQGTLLDCSRRSLLAANSSSNSPSETILTMQNGNYFFSVEAPGTVEFAGLDSIPIGSKLSVAGICVLQAAGEGKVEAVQVLLPDRASLQILERPNWWTPQRLLIGLGVLLAMSLMAIAWTITILRKNSALNASIAEKIQVQEQLQKANDLLESRVEERTRELKFEMGARQKAVVKFNAVIAERTRLAQELHDTLLQGFTGIGLKLDAFAQGLPASLAAGREKLQQILEQSDQYLAEARRTIWELRSPSFEKHQDFSKALSHACNRTLQGTNIRLSFSVQGAPSQLPPAVEDNLLRICEEAVTNAVRHARPQDVHVDLLFNHREVQMRVRDNGCGFNPEGPDGSKAGHFGLVGIRERVKSLNGSLSLNSQPNKGTEVIVTAPVVITGSADE